MKYSDTQFLRAIGMILIINSHLDLYYPIPYIGTGGAIGNSIFFCLSAFGIHLSQKKKHKSFSDWFKGRISRIYPSMWIVNLLIAFPIMLILGDVNDEYVMTFIGKFFNPPHWFIRALLVYYLISFFLLGNETNTKLFRVFVSLGGFYFVVYFTCVDLSKWSVEDTSIKLIHYFMIYLFGIYMASHSRSIKYTGINNYFIVLIIITAIYSHKFLMTMGMFTEFQVIQQIAMYPFLFYMLKVSRSPLVTSILMRKKMISVPIIFISIHTLELYIIQETIHYPVLKMNFPFPKNALIFIALILVLSAIVKKIADTIRARIL